MIKQTIHVVLAFAAFSLGAGYVPEAWNLEARQKFAEQRFGIFIHWGLYAGYAQGVLLCREWQVECAAGYFT